MSRLEQDADCGDDDDGLTVTCVSMVFPSRRPVATSQYTLPAVMIVAGVNALHEWRHTSPSRIALKVHEAMEAKRPKKRRKAKAKKK